jgi:HPt (histidine-containing phosphotransfer) domain-containing protein/Fe-S-cluster containining protein
VTPAFRDLEALYADLEAELARARPLCRQSSRCCRFKEYGHQLWVTALELEWLKEGHPPRSGGEGACPFLEGGLCGARERRMLGCRIYFCDPAFKEAMGPIYETYHARLKGLHGRHGIPYRYGEFLAEWGRTCREADALGSLPAAPQGAGVAKGLRRPPSGSSEAEMGHVTEEIDAEALERLRAVGGQDLLIRILDLFLENAPKRLAAIREGIAGEAWYEAERAAHSMKSSAANLGLKEIRDLAARLEIACEEHRTPEATPLKDALEIAFETARPRLLALRAAP